MNGAPPADIDAGLLFRLHASPSPRYPIAHRLSAIPTVPLYARALTPLEREAVADAARGAPEGVDATNYAVALFAAVVMTREGRPVFASEDEAGSLGEGEALALYRATRVALDVIAPSFASSHTKAWKASLTQGARAHLAIAHRMYSCSDVTLGYGASMRTGRPDRYWGKPVCELTDGQVMAFASAFEVVAALLQQDS